MTSKPEEYRDRAEHCRQVAEQVISPRDKEAWLQLAAEWMTMASLRERFISDQTKIDAQSGTRMRSNS